MFILFQDLEEKKFNAPDRAWEKTLLTRLFKVSELPHFATSLRRSLLSNVGVKQDNLNDKILVPLARMGFLELTDSDHFQFRVPVYRFVDLCMQFANEEMATKADEQKPVLAAEQETVTSQDDETDIDPEEAPL